MTRKPEPPQVNKKKIPAIAKRQEESQESLGPESQAQTPLLATDLSDLTQLTAFLDKANEATRTRVVIDLQQKHGNQFVQRLLVQRDATSGEPSTPQSQGPQRDESQQWGQWLESAKSGVKTGVSSWKISAALIGVTVNAVTASGGILTGAPIMPAVSAALVGEGAPAKVALAFARAAHSAWIGWTTKVNVPGLPWYPAFAAFPGPMAPPTANVPTPFIAIANGAFINPGTVSNDIISGLGSDGKKPEALDAALAFSTWLSASLINWLVATNVMMVMGTGPVPTFSPPYVPVGPVVGGVAIASPGFLLLSPPFGE